MKKPPRDDQPVREVKRIRGEGKRPLIQRAALNWNMETTKSPKKSAEKEKLEDRVWKSEIPKDVLEGLEITPDGVYEYMGKKMVENEEYGIGCGK